MRPSASLFCSLAFSLLSPIIGLSQCAPPEQPGVRICAPSQNATVSFPFALHFNSTPAAGSEIDHWIIYDNGKKLYQGMTGDTGNTIFNVGIFNGRHNITIHAWDLFGNLYEDKVSITVTGDGFGWSPCAAPPTPGINFCDPPNNVVLSTDYTVNATATGHSRIDAIRLYVDGIPQVTTLQTNELLSGASVGSQGDHTVAVVAWDSTGHVFKQTRKIHSSYTYARVDCRPNPSGQGETCGPGFNTTFQPPQDLFVDNSFTIQTQVENNPHTITAIKAYLDNTLVATSYGPVMLATVNGAPSGTHILTLQAWDTKGTLYRYRYNINVNLPH
jgi:hypothetical protein